jgi:hypothetical protein
LNHIQFYHEFKNIVLLYINMSINILLFNPGLDKVPPNKEKYTTLEDYNKITKSRFLPYRGHMFSCDKDNDFVVKYNCFTTKVIDELVKKYSIDICVLQEICYDNIDSYGFYTSVAGFTRYPGGYATYECMKTLLVGTYNNKIIIEVPAFLNYMQKDAAIMQGSKNITTIPNDLIQAVKINAMGNIIYIINVHRRRMKDIDNFKYYLHLIGIILNILKNDRANSNIMICGDNNSISLFSQPYSKAKYTTWAELQADIDALIDFIQKNKTPSDVAYSMVNIVLRLLFFIMVDFSLARYKFEDIHQKLFNDCKTVYPYDEINVNDILYSRFNDKKFSNEVLVDEDKCKFVLTTSSHIPYVIKLNISDNKESGLKDNSALLKKLFDNVDIIMEVSSVEIRKVCRMTAIQPPNCNILLPTKAQPTPSRIPQQPTSKSRQQRRRPTKQNIPLGIPPSPTVVPQIQTTAVPQIQPTEISPTSTIPAGTLAVPQIKTTVQLVGGNCGNYQNKYIKYKKKYLNLKNAI